MKIKFIKASAAGNDFVIIDNRSQDLSGDLTNFIKIVSHRRFGIGADGIILIEFLNGEYIMKYYNSDGGLGSLCGNGARSTAKFIYEKIEKSEIIHFIAVGKKYSAIVKGEMVRLFLPDMDNSIITKNISTSLNILESHFIDTGSPHAVVFTDKIKNSVKFDEIDVYKLGKEIRHSPEYQPGGANINFIEIKDTNEINIRTFERGVEDETLACGSGSVAAAIVSYYKKNLKLPITLNNRGKEKFLVGFRESDNTLTGIFLEGRARLVFEGNFEYDEISKEVAIIS